MHGLIRGRLEEVLEQTKPDAGDLAHLEECGECRAEVAAMREQAALLRELRAPADVEPRPGFYARVMERIEAQGAVSIWNLFFESPFGRRIAVAAMALALLMGVYLITAERMEEQLSAGQAVQSIVGEDQPGSVLIPSGAADPDSVLVNLVTYQEQ
jgi:predicted anti-sigma-YlaC factor YlaD